VLALLPFILISFLKDTIQLFNNNLLTTLDGYFNTANFFAVFWLIAMLINSNKQRKALQKERNKRLQEEAESKVIAARKAELEEIVTERTWQLRQQKEELEKAINELRATQDQLIQKEKLASLGELTAGIAHEIQNPLNFVNNFSELSTEMFSEMKEELKSGNEEGAIAIATDIEKNLEKINVHGKRADSIVKGMLQHSRSNTGEKKLTDINALADEYLRLAYHGWRAKDHSFNASMITKFDPMLEKVNIVPQEIGRVFLNLYNNAFYAMQQKQKQNMDGYNPEILVSTLKKDHIAEIRVKDNGTGIPEHIKDKILQPFFSTKPTGEGTGLGLSLSYDIIVKGHGGGLKTVTIPGEFTEFIITIPQ
jgi:signal transduction histidine kinase